MNARHILLCAVLLSGTLRAADAPGRKVVHREDPEYPELAARNSLHGTVRLRIWIAPDGSVRRLEYIGGHPVLVEAALKAVKNWKFELAGKESTEIVEVKF